MEQAEVRVRGRVQGVGFRPTVWRLAHEFGLTGEVLNDAEGVLIRLTGADRAIAALIERLARDPPPLSRIDSIERAPAAAPHASGFRIVESAAGAARTEIAPDAALCDACANEVFDPAERRHRYGLTNCTQCGPRFSIVRAIPYDRASTTLADFPLCPACRHEYTDAADRRFHAEAIACPACGPHVRLTPAAGDDPIAAAAALLRNGCIVAVKGLGGYQLACDATNDAAVRRLRVAKRRRTKPFALMARDLDTVRRHCAVSTDAAALLASTAAPIVLLPARGRRVSDAVAPGMTTLGCMLPTTPLHLLLLHDIDRPVVMTSGNLSDAPQITDDAEALTLCDSVADAVLSHDRPIAARIDDSVVRIIGGQPRTWRRARGFAPAGLRLPEGFAAAPDLLAAGGELKATFCLLKAGTAFLSQHIGDLEDARTFDDYRSGLRHYANLFGHEPTAVAIDPHPEYLASKHAREMGLPLIEVQHHHAHVAACLAENGRALDAPAVLGVVLDGLGWGEDGTLWGGEYLLADYRTARRLASFAAVAMPGGAAAVREPWRNLYAHLLAAGLDPSPLLADKPCAQLGWMIRHGVNAPLASSCGRLFDAMAAALGLCRDRQDYEGEAASQLEALVCDHTLRTEDDGLAYPMPPWRAVQRDLDRAAPPGVMAARFHKGLAIEIVAKAMALAEHAAFDTVALSGGCFQNAVLLEQIERRLGDVGFSVLTHRTVPCNDGGLSLGQAAIAAACLISAA